MLLMYVITKLISKLLFLMLIIWSLYDFMRSPNKEKRLVQMVGAVAVFVGLFICFGWYIGLGSL